jgi:hypothetical protein
VASHKLGVVCGASAILAIRGERPRNGVRAATMSQICKYCDSCRGVESSNRSDPPAIRSLRGDRPLLPGCYVVEVCGPKMKWGEITPAVVPKRGPHSIPVVAR